MRSDQHLDLQWRDGDVPVSTQFDDPYFSLEDGLVRDPSCVSGRQPPARAVSPGVSDCRAGLWRGPEPVGGTASVARERPDRRVLRYTSFEAFPMPPEAMIRAQAGFAALGELAGELAPFWRQGKPGLSICPTCGSVW